MRAACDTRVFTPVPGACGRSVRLPGQAPSPGRCSGLQDPWGGPPGSQGSPHLVPLSTSGPPLDAVGSSSPRPRTQGSVPLGPRVPTTRRSWACDSVRGPDGGAGRRPEGPGPGWPRLQHPCWAWGHDPQWHPGFKLADYPAGAAGHLGRASCPARVREGSVHRPLRAGSRGPVLSVPAFPKVPRRQKLSPEPSQSCPCPAGLPAASEHPETRSAPPSTIGAGLGTGSGLTELPVPARSARWWVSHWGGGCRRGRTSQSCAAGLPRGGQGPWALEMASDLVPAGKGGVQVPWSRGPGAAPGPPSQLPETPSACHHTTASRKTRGGLCLQHLSREPLGVEPVDEE